MFKQGGFNFTFVLLPKSERPLDLGQLLTRGTKCFIHNPALVTILLFLLVTVAGDAGVSAARGPSERVICV